MGYVWHVTTQISGGWRLKVTHGQSVEFETLQLSRVGDHCAVFSREEILKDKKKRRRWNNKRFGDLTGKSEENSPG